MDLNSFFRIFFNGSSGWKDDPFFEIDDKKNERMNTVHDDFFETFDHHMNMFQQIENMFDKTFSSSYGMIGIPKLDEISPDKQLSPRSIMIKDDFEEKPCGSSSCQKDLGTIDLTPHENDKQFIVKPHFFSYSRFTSSKTVRLPDGTVEEHRTVIDNDGNKTTTVHRSGPGSEVITKRYKPEIKDEITNLEQMWSKLQNRDRVEPFVNSPSSSSYWDRLKKFLSPSGKYEVKSC